MIRLQEIMTSVLLEDSLFLTGFWLPLWRSPCGKDLWGAECCQQLPRKLEAHSPPINASDECTDWAHTFTAALWVTVKQRNQLSNVQISNQQKENIRYFVRVCCFKSLGFVAICYTAIDNQCKKCLYTHTHTHSIWSKI